MNLQFLNQSNKVHQQLLDYRLLTEVMFLAEAEREGFTDVLLLTSTAHRKDLATEMAFQKGATLDNIDRKLKEIEAKLPLEQFVEVLSDKVIVVLNVPEINDRAVNKAMSMLFKVSEFKPGLRMTFHDEKNTVGYIGGNPDA